MRKPYFLIKRQMDKIQTDRRDENERNEDRSFYFIEEEGEDDEDIQTSSDKEQ